MSYEREYIVSQGAGYWWCALLMMRCFMMRRKGPVHQRLQSQRPTWACAQQHRTLTIVKHPEAWRVCSPAYLTLRLSKGSDPQICAPDERVDNGLASAARELKARCRFVPLIPQIGQFRCNCAVGRQACRSGILPIKHLHKWAKIKDPKYDCISMHVEHRTSRQ